MPEMSSQCNKNTSRDRETDSSIIHTIRQEESIIQKEKYTMIYKSFYHKGSQKQNS